MLYDHCPATLFWNTAFWGLKKNRRLQQNGTHHLLVYADDIKLLAKNTSSKMKKDFRSKYSKTCNTWHWMIRKLYQMEID